MHTGELTAYLKHNLGWDDSIKYMKENSQAKEKAFGLTGQGSPQEAESKQQRPGPVSINDEQELMDEVLGGQDTKVFGHMEVWKCQRFVMTEQVRRILFSEPHMWAHPNADLAPIERSPTDD